VLSAQEVVAVVTPTVAPHAPTASTAATAAMSLRMAAKFNFLACATPVLSR
jgi:hypothetical protein